jgi:acyl-homoserine lactone acylase PvdQ
MVAGPGATTRSAARAALPAWAENLAGGLKLPTHASNALLVDAAHSVDGRPLAAMGPQVSYYTPEIFVEYELHGPGFDASGVAFPGAAPYVLIGHGKDFAWTGTTPNGDTVDTFAELLCNADGSPATTQSMSYMHGGTCTPFITREQTMRTPVAPTSPKPSQQITLRALRSVHGPVIAYGTVAGAPVAFTEQHQTFGLEARSLIAFKQLGEGRATDGASFQQVMRNYTGEENWFYAGKKDIAWIRSGLVPRHAKGTNPDFPIMGTGKWDWNGVLPPEANPREINPPGGFLSSWNNKENPGDPAPPATWSFGPVQRQQMLVRQLRADEKRRGGKVDLAELARISVRAATTDLRGEELVSYIGRVMGTPADPATAQALQTLEAWAKAGSQRRDVDGDGVVDDSRAVALMDTWWPLLVRRIFEPKLGNALIDSIVEKVNPLASKFMFDGWYGYVQKDLRTVLHRPVKAWPKTAFCGGGGLVSCRKLLTDSLSEVAAQVPVGVRVPTTCPETKPVSCDQIVPMTAGAVSVKPFPFHNRGTFHQLVEVGGPSGG